MSYYVALRGIGDMDLWSSNAGNPPTKPKAPQGAVPLKAPVDANWYGEGEDAIKASPMGQYIASRKGKEGYPLVDGDRGFICRTVMPGFYQPGKPIDTTNPMSSQWLVQDPNVAVWCMDWNIATAKLVGGTPGASAQLLKHAAERFGSWEFDKRHYDWVKGQIAVKNLFNKK